MSEQINNPEKNLPRLYDNCNDCEQDYDLTPENASLHLHDVNPDCNFLAMTCTCCGHNWVMFGLSEDMELNAVRHGIPTEVLRFPQDNTLNKRLGFLGIKLVQSGEITPRHEALVSNFASVLENAPDEHLFNFITDENPNRPYSPRWR